jgi:hypothetical protein
MSLYKTYKSGEEKFDNKVNEIKQYQPFENDMKILYLNLVIK